MRVAVATCRGRVSQRLDCADELVVFNVRDSRARDRQDLDLREWPPHGRSARIVRLEIDRLICGAVSSFDEAGLDNSKVRLILGVTGPIEAVITAVLSGAIASGQSYWEEQLDARRRGA